MNLHERINMRDSEGNFVLVPLPYTDDHLEPFIGYRTVYYHYWRHLKTYIAKVNELKNPLYKKDIEDLIFFRDRDDLYDNASQVYNHYFYFEQLNSKSQRKKYPLTLTEELMFNGRFG